MLFRSMQLIIENAVEHGMESNYQGKVILRIQRVEEEFIKIEVEDNGQLSDKDKERIHQLLNFNNEVVQEKRVSLGIRNVDQRIKIIYGNNCGLSIKSNEQNHTICTILLQI